MSTIISLQNVTSSLSSHVQWCPCLILSHLLVLSSSTVCIAKEETFTLPALTWTSRDWIFPSSFSAMQRYVWGWSTWRSWMRSTTTWRRWTWWGVEKKTHLGVHLLLVVAGAEGRKDQVSVVHNLAKIFYNLGKVIFRTFEQVQKCLHYRVQKSACTTKNICSKRVIF